MILGAAETLEIACKAFVVLTSTSVAFCNATVASPKLLATCDNATVALVALVEPLVRFAVVGWLALSTGKATG